MIAPDSSVLIPALAPWHEAHTAARKALRGTESSLIAHVAFETIASLSRMPEGRRVSAAVVLEALSGLFPGRWMTLGSTDARKALERAVSAGLRGGALYDALVAATAARHHARLLSADLRARRTYEALAVEVTYVTPSATP